MRDDLVCYIPQHVEYLAYVCFFLLFILSSLTWLSKRHNPNFRRGILKDDMTEDENKNNKSVRIRPPFDHLQTGANHPIMSFSFPRQINVASPLPNTN